MMKRKKTLPGAGTASSEGKRKKGTQQHTTTGQKKPRGMRAEDVRFLFGIIWPHASRLWPGLVFQFLAMTLSAFVVPMRAARILDMRGGVSTIKAQDDDDDASGNPFAAQCHVASETTEECKVSSQHSDDVRRGNPGAESMLAPFSFSFFSLVVSEDVWRALMAVLALQLLAACFRALERLVLERRSVEARIAVERRLFAKCVSLDEAFFGRSKVGELLAAMTNPGVSYYCSEALPHCAKTMVALVGGLIAMFATHATLATVATLTAPLLFAVQKVRARLARRAAKQADAARAKAHALAAESLTLSSTVRAHAAEDFEIAAHFRATRDVVDCAAKAARVDVAWGAAADACVAFGDALFLLAAVALGMGTNGGVRSSFGRTSVGLGAYVSFRSSLGQYQRGLREATKLATKVAQSWGHAARVVQLLKTEPTVPPPLLSRQSADPLLLPPGPDPPAFDFDDVTFRYDDAPRRSLLGTGTVVVVKAQHTHTPPVLDGCAFVAAAGATTALVGASGSGKSTVGKLLLRLYDPSAGRVLCDGVPLTRLDPRSHRRRFGVVDQSPVLFDRSLAENIAYGLDDRDVSRDKIVRAAKAAAVHDVIEALDGGYDSVAGERGTRLSGGQQQRVALARALVRDPTCLLLDEATSALDGRTERLVQDAILGARLVAESHDSEHDTARRLPPTTIVIAHRLSTIAAADLIVVLDEGRVVETGAHDELLRRRGKYFDMYQAFHQQGATTARMRTGGGGVDRKEKSDATARPRPRGNASIVPADSRDDDDDASRDNEHKHHAHIGSSKRSHPLLTVIQSSATDDDDADDEDRAADVSGRARDDDDPLTGPAARTSARGASLELPDDEDAGHDDAEDDAGHATSFEF